MRHVAAALTLILLGCRSSTGSAPVPALAAREGYVTASDGVRLYYRALGEAPSTVIVLHGGPGLDHTYMLPTIDQLARTHTVVFYDQRGGGRSDAVTDVTRLAYSHHVSDLEALRDHLGLAKVTLLAHSMGALLAGFYASEHPTRVERLVLVGAPAPVAGQPHLDFWTVVQARLRERGGAGVTARLEPLYEPQRWEEAVDPVAVCREYYALLMTAYTADPRTWERSQMDACGAPPEAVRRQRRVTRQILSTLGKFDLRPALGHVSAPTLIVHGTHEPIPLEVAWTWARAMPDARVLLIANAGHFPQAEQAPLFLTAVSRFLAGAWPATAEVVSR